MPIQVLGAGSGVDLATGMPVTLDPSKGYTPGSLVDASEAVQEASVSNGQASWQPAKTTTDSSAVASAATSIGTALVNVGGLLGASFINAGVQKAAQKNPSLFGMFAPTPAPKPPAPGLPSWLLPAALAGGVVIFMATRSRGSSSASVRTNPSKKRPSKQRKERSKKARARRRSR